MHRRAFVASLLGAQLRKINLVLPSATASSASISTSPAPAAGTITILKPAGAVSCDITVKLPRYTVFISTPNSQWGLAFAQELLNATSAAPARNQPEKEKCA